MSRYLPRINRLVCFKLIFLITAVVCVSSAVAQTISVTGKITDFESGEPLPAVSVTQKGHSNATMSDINGVYTLKIVSEMAPVLVFSSIGYVSQEIALRAQTSVNVRLVSDAKALEEVVVVGFGTQKKESVVGSIVQTTGDALLRQSVPEVANALTGLLPGLETIQSSSLPGGSGPNDEATRIYIRGRSTWNAAQPLVLIDGVERSINDVDAFEIDKISVLKDASATAVFGVKGANGVILITTKRGKEGKTVLNADAQMSVNSLSRQYEMMNSYDGNYQKNLAILNEVTASPSSWSNYKPLEILKYYKTQEYPDIFPDVDWADEFTRDFSTSQRVNLNASGGTKFAKYFGSLSYLKQGDIIATKDYGQGYTPSFTYNRFNFRSNLDLNITKTTKVSVNLAGMYGVQKSPNGDNIAYSTFWKSLYGHPPDVYPVRYSDGSWGENPADDKFWNGVTAVNFNGVKSENRTQVNTDLNLEQKLDFITKGFSILGRLSFDNYFRTLGQNTVDNGVVTKFIPSTVIDFPMADWENYAIYTYPVQPSQTGYGYSDLPNTYTNELATVNGQNRATDYQLTINYARDFGKHAVTGLALVKREERAIGEAFLDKREDWVGRLTYGYDSRYLVEFNGAYNGSQKFDREYRFGFFPSMAIGWVISNENFFKDNVRFVDLLKFRYSNGKVGNDNIGVRTEDIVYMNTWDPLTNTWQFGAPTKRSTGMPITLEGSIANPNIHWETAHKQNFGIDAAFFKEKLKVTFEYFKETNSQIFMHAADRSGNDIFGAPLPPANIGETKSHGWEIDLEYRQRVSKTFGFDVRYTQSFAKNLVTSRDDRALAPDYQKRAGYLLGQHISQVNQPGLIQSWDDIYTGVLGEDNKMRLPGDFRQIDFNADGVINGDDAVPYGYTGIPQYTHSLNIGFNYKRFNASILFYGVWNVNFKTNHVEFNETYTVINPSIASDAWNPEMGNTSNAAYNGLRLFTSSPKGNFFLEDGSYTRIKSADIGYTFNNKLLANLGVSSARIYLRGYNLALWSKMREDRESQGGTLSNRTMSYPMLRTYTFGLSVGF